MFHYWPYLGGLQELLGSVGLLSLTHVLVCIAQRLELLMVLLQVVVLAYKSSEKGKKNGTYGRICINVPCDGDHFVYISIFTCHETIRS